MANYKIFYKGVALGGNPDAVLDKNSRNTIENQAVAWGISYLDDRKLEKKQDLSYVNKLAYVKNDGYIGWLNQSDVQAHIEDNVLPNSSYAVKSSGIYNFVDSYTNTYTAQQIVFDLNAYNYVLTAYIKDANNRIISYTSCDFPSEEIIISGRYDETTKELVLKLKSGAEIRIPVGDIVTGLVNEKNVIHDVLNAYSSATQAYVFSAYAGAYTWSTMVEGDEFLQSEIEVLDAEKLDVYQLAHKKTATNTYLAYVQADGYIGWIDQKEVTPEYDTYMSDTSYNAVGNAYIKNYVDTAYQTAYDYMFGYLLQQVIYTDEKVTAYAITYLNEIKANSYVGTAYEGFTMKVDSTGYIAAAESDVKFLTKDQYNALPASAKAKDILYVVTD